MSRGQKRKDPESPTQQDTLPSTQTDPQTPAHPHSLPPIQLPACSDTSCSSSVLTTQSSSSTAPSTDPAAWKLPLGAVHQPYQHWSEVQPDIHNMWWGEFQRGQGAGKQTGGSISFIEHQLKRSEDKKGQYVDFHSEEFWKAEKEAIATTAPLPDDLRLMATVSGGLDRSRSYGVGSEEAHLRAESSLAAAGLPLCYLEAE
ncbi:hypothetical protein M9H77_17137 [Catharanthus roseus]|uniref:Uncharacterized protein n=1 Tax=Catharanthus roseus TaxID=4058 RepID=A0ACC0B3T0_CATRO|nr:hypothetical protein M9H77_17137 [Catharanthus roseus]